MHGIVLSIHLLGVFIMLMGIGLMLTTMIGLHRTTTMEGLRQVLYAGRYVEKIMPLGAAIVLFAGIWLAFMKDPDYSWHSAWIITAFILVIAFSVNGAVNIGKKMERIAGKAFRGPASTGTLSPELQAMCNDPTLHYTAWAGMGVIFSFIVLMVEKPGWLGSVLWVLIGAAVGLVANGLAASSRLTLPKGHRRSLT